MKVFKNIYIIKILKGMTFIVKTIIAKESENDRIDAYIAKKEDISRVTVQRLIKEGKIKINTKIGK